tara:strand:+ start:2176 stop:2943 length:768 start_codon:yes stop_codon:yes gene_type:complete
MPSVLVINIRGDSELYDVQARTVDDIETYIFPEELHIISTGLTQECDFKCEEYTICIYGNTDGDPGNENKKELPPPIDNELYYGSIIVCAHNENQLENITLEMFETFYDKAFGGFETLGEEDTWSVEDEENSEDREFIDNAEEYGIEDSSEEEYNFSDISDSDEHIELSDLHSSSGSLLSLECDTDRIVDMGSIIIGATIYVDGKTYSDSDKILFGKVISKKRKTVVISKDPLCKYGNTGKTLYTVNIRTNKLFS